MCIRDSAWTIAIVAGAVTDVIVLLAGSLVLGISPRLIAVIVGSLVSAVLAFILQLVVFSLDYTRTEYVQFEDDEYYYYVKAVSYTHLDVYKRQLYRWYRSKLHEAL